MRSKYRKWVEPILRFIQRQENVEMILAINLWTFRIHEICRRSYEKKFGKAIKKNSSQQVIRRPNQDRLSTSTRSQFISDGNDNKSNYNTLNSDTISWQWKFMPVVPRFLITYEHVSSCFFVYVLLKGIMPDYLTSLVSLLNLPLEAHCYLVGNVASHPSIERQIALLFAIYHIAWRLSVYMSNRPYFFGLYVFLAMTDNDLEKFYQLIESQPKAKYKSLQNNVRSNKSDSMLGLSCLFRSSICYRVIKNRQIYYKIKPNRNWTAREILRHKMAETVPIIAATYAILTIIITSLVLNQVFSKQYYQTHYPNCGQDENDFSSLTFHQVVAISSDILTSAIVWIDTGIAVIFAWGAVYILNFDNQFHIEKINQKLDLLKARILISQSNYEFGIADRFVAEESNPGSVVTQTDSYKLDLIDSDQLESKLLDITMELDSFFDNIKKTDLIVSDMITTFIFVCVTLFAVFGDQGMNLPAGGSDATFLLLICLVGLSTYIIVTIGWFSLLNLNTSCYKSYKTICSLVAHHKSDQKRNLLNLLEFFVIMKRSTYTILHLYPFTKTTYLSIFGWTFSTLFIFDGFRKRP